MSNFGALTILGNTEAQWGNTNFPQKPSAEILSKEELNAAEVLYELANGIGLSSMENVEEISDCNWTGKGSLNLEKTNAPTTRTPGFAGKKLGKRELREDGSTSRSDRKVKHLTAVHDANDHSGSEKLTTGTSSKKGFTLLGSYIEPNLSSKAIQIPSENRAVAAPTYPSEFSFSVIHLLSAVRAALTTPLPVEYALICGRPLDEILSKKNPPFLNIYEIVQRVRSRPGDPCILQCQEPLIELVRGVLKIFSSEIPPLTLYDRLKKKWQWIGPMPNSTEVEISYKDWGLLHENFVKLMNQSSMWLRRMQPSLKLIGNLPKPPLGLMQEIDFHTRFDNRKRLNQATICPSCDEVRAYFHREEAIRYMIPERGFFYTALDGKKSAVAPLRKNSYKEFARTRGHHVFKANRPPQFSLLSLVRDAAARLPGGLGTRTDICNLIRESQYVIENIEEKTVKLVVSGALDRLQCEVDPCVEYNEQWRLWVYLHRDREVDDFLENGTSSTKKRGPASDEN